MESEGVAQPVDQSKKYQKHGHPQYLLPFDQDNDDHCCVCKTLCPYSQFKEALIEKWDNLDETSKKCCCCCQSCYKSPCCYLCCCYPRQPCECLFPRCCLCPCCYCACCQTCPRCIACGWCLYSTREDFKSGLIEGLIMVPVNLAMLCLDCDCCLCCLCGKAEDSISEDSQQAPNQQPTPPNQQQVQDQQREIEPQNQNLQPNQEFNQYPQYQQLQPLPQNQQNQPQPPNQPIPEQSNSKSFKKKAKVENG